MRIPHLLVLLASATLALAADPGLRLDPKKIINESNSFLRNREPEMTGEEYALYEKASSLLNTQPDFALVLLQGMVNEKEKPSPAFEFILGNACYYAGKSEEAALHYKNAVNRYPDFLRAWSNLGVLYYSTHEYKKAVPCLAKSVALGDRDPKTFGLLAYCLERTDNIVQAEMAYMQALAGDPLNGDWMEGLLRIYIQGKQFGRAEWLVKNLIHEKPTEARYWMVYANVLLSQGRKLEAMALLEACLGTGVAGSEELSTLADLYAEFHLVPEAAAVYEKLRAADADLGEKKILQLASLLISTGDSAKAEVVLASLKEPLSPEGRIGLLQNRADCFCAEKKWTEADTTLDELLRIAPLNGPALFTRGMVYLGQEDTDRAQIAFEHAAKVPASAFRANLQLANLAMRRKHYQEAVAFLEKALAIERLPAVQDYLARVRTLAEPSKESTQ